MDFTTAVSIISKDLEEAGILLDQLSRTAVNNMAELKLARSRVRSAAEILAVLPSLTDMDKPAPKIEVKAKAKEETVAESQAEIRAEAKIEIKEKVEANEKTETEAGATEEIIEVVTAMPEAEAFGDIKATVKEEAIVEIKAEVAKTREPARAPESNKSRLADTFNDSGRMVEQVNRVRQDEAITSALHAKPIADIAAAIGINDKFYFIRELFSGDGKAYIDTIGRLNSAASLGEAMRILDESTVMGSDPAAQSSFVDVVRRKFNING